MNEQEREVLGELRGGDWVRPMDVGGTDGSHHSRTLARLSEQGLAERRKRNTLTNVVVGGRRGSYVYRITEAGETEYSYNT